MIIESIVLGATAIIVSSLVFTNHLLKMERENDRKDDLLAPFLNIVVDTCCPMCGRACTDKEGLRQPQACSDENKCEETRSHLHCRCTYCESRWIMSTGIKNARTS